MQQFFDFPVTPSFSFEDFVSCEGNSAALRFARRVADPADPEKLLYIHGSTGSGKTHLLKSIAGDRLPYISFRDRPGADLLLDTFGAAPGLLLDDLHEIPEDDPGLKRVIWQLFNDFHTSGRPIGMSGLCPPRELHVLDEHLTSRLLWGLVARLDTSDDDSRRMILKKVAEDRQIRIQDDVIEYILVTTSREVGDLIAGFNRLYSFSMSQKRPITLPLARMVREQVLSGHPS